MVRHRSSNVPIMFNSFSLPLSLSLTKIRASIIGVRRKVSTPLGGKIRAPESELASINEIGKMTNRRSSATDPELICVDVKMLYRELYSDSE